MTTPIIIPICYHTELTASLIDLEIAYKLRDCETKKRAFMVIDGFEPYIDKNDDNKEYTLICSGGEAYICPMTFTELKEFIIREMSDK